MINQPRGVMYVPKEKFSVDENSPPPPQLQQQHKSSSSSSSYPHSSIAKAVYQVKQQQKSPLMTTTSTTTAAFTVTTNPTARDAATAYSHDTFTHQPNNVNNGHGLFFRRTSVHFGSVDIGTLSRMRIELCNATDHQVRDE